MRKYFIFDEYCNPSWLTHLQVFVIMFVILPAVGMSIAMPVAFMGNTMSSYHAQKHYVK